MIHLVVSFETIYYTLKTSTCSLSYDFQKIFKNFVRQANLVRQAPVPPTICCTKSVNLIKFEFRFYFKFLLFLMIFFSQLKLSVLTNYIISWMKSNNICNKTKLIFNINAKLNELKIYIVEELKLILRIFLIYDYIFNYIILVWWNLLIYW